MKILVQQILIAFQIDALGVGPASYLYPWRSEGEWFSCFTLSYTHSIPSEHLSLHRISFQVKMFDNFYYGINKRCQRLDQQVSNILLKFTIKNVIKRGGGGA